MRFTLFVLALIIFNLFPIIGYGQNPNKSIILKGGISKFNCRNEFLNSYTYSGNMPVVNIEGRTIWRNNLIILQLNGSAGKLNALYTNKNIYDYNYINYRQISLSIGWYKQLFSAMDKSKIFYGLFYNPSFTKSTEHYSNLLYSGATGYRRFYSTLFLNLSPSIIYQFNFRQNSLELVLNYMFYNYGSIADDNYVKQLKDAEYSKVLHFFTPGEFSQTTGTISYIRSLKNEFAFMLKCSLDYQQLNYQSSVQSLDISLLGGIRKNF